MAARPIEIDEAAFARDYVSGKFTVARLAARHGISKSLAEKMISGERRPEVSKRIDQAVAAARKHATRTLVSLQPAAIDALGKAMRGRSLAAAISAAKEVLSRTMTDKQPAQGRWAGHLAGSQPSYPPDSPALVGLSEETRRRVLDELNGPEEGTRS